MHEATAAGFKYQAERDGEMEAYNQILDDPVKSGEVLAEIEREKVGRWRKKN